ncbi:hypothetical protein GQ457_13G009490 [Hibiscus cannabinus]
MECFKGFKFRVHNQQPLRLHNHIFLILGILQQKQKVKHRVEDNRLNNHASCGRQSTKQSLGPRGRKIMEGIRLYTNEKAGMQILNPGRPSQMLVRRPNTRSHATMSEPLILSHHCVNNLNLLTLHQCTNLQSCLQHHQLLLLIETSSINYSQEEGLVKQPLGICYILGSSMNI